MPRNDYDQEYQVRIQFCVLPSTLRPHLQESFRRHIQVVGPGTRLKSGGGDPRIPRPDPTKRRLDGDDMSEHHLTSPLLSSAFPFLVASLSSRPLPLRPAVYAYSCPARGESMDEGGGKRVSASQGMARLGLSKWLSLRIHCITLSLYLGVLWQRWYPPVVLPGPPSLCLAHAAFAGEGKVRQLGKLVVSKHSTISAIRSSITPTGRCDVSTGTPLIPSPSILRIGDGLCISCPSSICAVTWLVTPG